MELSLEVLEKMNDKKFSYNESKIFLSERVLIMNLDILRKIGEKNGFNYHIDTFKKINKAQKLLLAYLKMKYPRGGNTFVPGDLVKVFKSFDMVEYPENDILRNAGICFTDPSTK